MGSSALAPRAARGSSEREIEMKSSCVAIIIGLLSTPVRDVCADNHIYQHNGNLYPEINYRINQDALQVTILQGVQNETFEFVAVLYDPNGQYQSPGDINLIVADPNAGSVAITVVGSINDQHGQPYGAANVKQITLNAPGVTGVIQQLRVGGNLAELGPVLVHRLDGPIAVSDPSDPNYATAGAILNDLQIGWLNGGISCRTMQNLTVTDGTVWATVDIGDIDNPSSGYAYAGALSVVGDMNRIAIAGGLSGSIQVWAISRCSTCPLQTRP